MRQVEARSPGLACFGRVATSRRVWRPGAHLGLPWNTCSRPSTDRCPGARDSGARRGVSSRDDRAVRRPGAL